MLLYAQNKANAMIKHLASLSQDRLIISFAPKTLAYTVLKRIGELFPGPSKVINVPLNIHLRQYNFLILSVCSAVFMDCCCSWGMLPLRKSDAFAILMLVAAARSKL